MSGRPRFPREDRTCPVCSDVFETRTDSTQLCCSRPCARQRDNKLRPKNVQPRICPCGKDIPAPEYHQSPYAHNRKYCSSECRNQYGKKKQSDPDNYVTFNCLTCDKEVTRYKKYGNGASKYCSNTCASKHTKVKKHVVFKDTDVVLDSSWEALLYGIFMFLKIPIERFDRSNCIEFNSKIYGPDFYLPTYDIYVEVKGYEDQDDIDRYDAFKVDHTLMIVDHDLLSFFRQASKLNIDNYLYSIS